MSLAAQTLAIDGKKEGEKGESTCVSVSKWIWSGELRPDSIAGGIILRSFVLSVAGEVPHHSRDPKIPNSLL